MSSYCVFDFVKVLDSPGLDDYHREVLTSLDSFGGRYIVFGGQPQILQGTLRPAFPVLLEFPTMQQAEAWFRQSARPQLPNLAQFHCYLIDGF